jgi:hypothetical protein
MTARNAIVNRRKKLSSPMPNLNFLGVRSSNFGSAGKTILFKDDIGAMNKAFTIMKNGKYN